MDVNQLSNEELQRYVNSLENEIQQLRGKMCYNDKTFEQIFSNQKKNILVSDFNTGRIVYANPVACEFYGYSFDEFSNLFLSTLFASSSADLISVDGIVRHRKNDGTEVDVEINSSEFTLENIKYRLTIVSDLKTHADSFSAKFRETFSLYTDVLVGFFSFDNNYTIQNCNRSLSQITGYSIPELVGMNFLSLIDLKYHQQVIDNLLESNEARTEVEGIRKNGKTYPMMIQFRDGNHHEFVPTYAAIRDITEMKKSEEKLTLTKDTFVGIFNTLTEAIYVLDKNNRFVDVNDGAVKMYGYPKRELIGKSPSDVSAPGYNNLDNVIAASKRVMETGISEQFEFWGVRKNGEIFPKDVILNKGKYFGEDCIVATARDITERKTLEKKLQKAKEAAEESERLKTAFLQNMSHEIRTPLNAILGFTQMLGNFKQSDEKRKSFISIIETSAHQLLNIVNDILIASSLETGQERVHYDNVCINNVLLDLFAIYKEKAQTKNISLYLKTGLNDEQSFVKTDKTKITQIISNLLSNAVKFTNQGFIEFGYHLSQSDGEEKYLLFYVKDTGIGISPEWQQIIFDRFRQVENQEFRKYGGNGLGLAIAKGFVELLGGKIWVESKPSEGSTFFFTTSYISVDSDPQARDVVQPLEVEPLVLIAEDEDINLLYIEELLNLWGYQIIHAKDGREAIDMAVNNPRLALILMDIKMPEIDGYTAAKIIKQQRPELPIVAQTAYALEHEKQRYSDVFDEYLTKPVAQGKLKETLEKYIKQVAR